MERTTGMVDALGLVGPLTHWSAYECVVFTEGPGSWRPVLLTAVDAQGECTLRASTGNQQTMMARLLSRAVGEPKSRIQSSHSVRRSNWKLSGSLHCNWLKGPRESNGGAAKKLGY